MIAPIIFLFSPVWLPQKQSQEVTGDYCKFNEVVASVAALIKLLEQIHDLSIRHVFVDLANSISSLSGRPEKKYLFNLPTAIS